ncbi:MAG: PQQ-binding-like beta-propeller repeat protein [Planctomycetes bacterium]|nr:PQQ-binding-like beta-propeller repeat protein [Planctomycetota bacterium]
MRTSVLLLLSVLACVASLDAVDIAWPATTHGDAVPEGWDIHRAKESKGAIRFDHGQALLSSEPASHVHLVRKVGINGSDAAPLRAQCTIASEDDKMLKGLPTWIGLYWDATHVVCIGLGANRLNTELAPWEHSQRKAWCSLVDGEKRETKPADFVLYGAESPGHFRIVVTTRAISAQASRDGVSWRELASLERKAGSFEGPPAKVILGRGWIADKPDPANLDLDADIGDLKNTELIAYRFDRVSITNELPKVPPRAPAGYKKSGTWEDTLLPITLANATPKWQLLGPFQRGDPEYDPKMGVKPGQMFQSLTGAKGTKGTWVPHDLGDNPDNRLIDLRALLKITAKEQVGVAATTITVDQPRLERFIFYGGQAVHLFLNGRRIATSWRDEGWLIVDPLIAMAPLVKGENTVVAMVDSGYGTFSSIHFRHEIGDSLARIALNRQLIGDFPDDADFGMPAMQENARLWEAMGCAAQAVDAWGEILARDGLPLAQVSTACFERARLHRQMHDTDGVIADVEDLAQRQLKERDAADSVSSRLTVARLWEQMGFLDRSLAVIDDVVKQTDLDALQLIDAYLERSRLHQLLKKDAEVATDLRELSTRLPPDHDERFEFLLQSLELELRANKTSGLDREIAEMSKAKDAPRERLARLHALYSGRCEEIGDTAQRVAYLQHVIDHSVWQTDYDDVQVEVAEALLLPAKESKEVKEPAKDAAPPQPKLPDAKIVRDAVERYRLALARIGANRPTVLAAAEAVQTALASDPGKALALARSAYLRACLAESAVGDRLLKDSVSLSSGLGAKAMEQFGAVRDWQVVGPFENANWSAYAREIIPAAAVDTGKPVEGKAWQKPGAEFYGPTGLDLAKLLKIDNQVAFVTKRIDAETPFDAELACGADDGLIVWFNGKKIHEDRIQRGVVPGSLRFPVRFEKGANTILAMIQNGAGGWGIEMSIDPGASLGLSRLLAEMDRAPEARRDQCQMLFKLADDAQQANQFDEALAFAQAIIRSCPDRLDLQIEATNRTIARAQTSSETITFEPLAAWIESLAARRAVPEKDKVIADFRWRIATAMRTAGELQATAEELRLIRRTSMQSDAQVRVMVEQAQLQRIAGYPQAAAVMLRQALERGITDAEVHKRASQGLAAIRSLKSETPIGDSSLDAATMVATADRVAASNDVERALKSYQRAIEQHGRELYRLSPDKVVGVGEYCLDRIRALGPAGITGYRQLFDARAKDLYQLALENGSPDSLQDVISTYRFSSVADDALNRLASWCLDSGAYERASGLLSQLLADHPDTDLPAAMVLAKYAYAAEAARNPLGARKALDMLGLKFPNAQLTISGKQVAVGDWIAQRRTALDAGDPRALSALGVGSGSRRTGYRPYSPIPGPCTIETEFPQDPSDIAGVYRFLPSPYRHIAIDGAIDGGLACFHTLDETFAIDLADGRLRWRSRVPFPTLRRAERQPEFGGLPETMTAIQDGLVFARALRRSIDATDRFALEARELATGRLLWSSECLDGLSDASIASSPATSAGTVYAVAQQVDDRYRRSVVALEADSGRVLWRTPLMPGTPGLSLTRQQDLYLGDHLAAPSLMGNDVYVCTDAGSLVALDATSGAIRWIATYPHAWLDANESRRAIRQLGNRAASRVIVGQKSLYVAPRDCLAVLSVQRSNGDILWQQPLSDALALVGIAPDVAGSDGRLILQGRGLACFDTATGKDLWRWLPRAGGALHGIASLGGGFAYVSSESGLHRIRLTNGTLHASTPWSTLGITVSGSDGPIGNLMLLPDRIVAFGDRRVVVFGAATAEIDAKNPAPAPKHARLAIGDDSPLALATTTATIPDLSGGLALRWHLGTDLGKAIIESTSAGDQIYVLGGTSLSAMDLTKNELLWRTTIAAGSLRVVAGPGLLVAAYPHHLCAYDSRTGASLWTVAEAIGDSGFGLEYGPDEPHYAEITVSDKAVSVRRKGANRIRVLDAKTGRETTTVSYAGAVAATVQSGDDLVTIVRVGGMLAAEGTSLATGLSTWRVALSPDLKEQKLLQALPAKDGKTLYLFSDNNAIGVDLAGKRELFAQSIPIGYAIYPYIDAGRPVVFAERGDVEWYSMIFDPASGKCLLEEKVEKNWVPFPHSALQCSGDRAVNISIQRVPGHYTTICRSLSTGKDLWTIDRAEQWSRKFVQVVVTPTHVVQIWFAYQTNLLGYTLIDIETGKVLAEGELPGSVPAVKDFPATFLAGQLVYGSHQGFYSVAGLPSGAQREAVLAGIRDGKPPESESLRAGLSEFAAVVARETRLVLSTAKPMTVDGRLDDWTTIEPISMNHWTRRRGSDASGSAAARLRLTWDKRNLYIAVDAEDDVLTSVAPGQSPIEGDSLSVAIDSDLDGFNRNDASKLIVLQLALVDGQTRLTQASGRSLDLGDDGRPEARIGRTAKGLVYEIAVPWASLRSAADQRPGSVGMAIGVAITDRDRTRADSALEWGNALTRGLQARLLKPLAFVDLTPELIEQYRSLIAMLPSHAVSWKLLQRLGDAATAKAGIPGRIATYEQFLNEHPESAHAKGIIDEIGRLHQQAGDKDPAPKLAPLLAKTSGAKAVFEPAVLRREKLLKAANLIPDGDDVMTFLYEVEALLHKGQQGTWKGVHGADGYVLAGDTVKPPSYAKVTITGHQDYVWAPTTPDERALQKAGADDRIAACWYVDGTITVDLDLTDGATHRVRLYCLDWDSGRANAIQIAKAADGAVIDGPRTIGGLNNGCWAVWDIKGHVKVTLAKAGAHNAVLSGIFFDPVPKDAKPVTGDIAAAFVSDDSMPANWFDKNLALYMDWIRANPTSPQAFRPLVRVRDWIAEISKGDKQREAMAGCERLMDEVNFSRSQRRAFYDIVGVSIPQWRALGYFDPQKGAESLHETLAPEKRPVDVDDHFVGIRNRDLVWRDLRSLADWSYPVNILGGVPPEAKPAVCYLYTRFECATAHDAYVMFGARSPALMWVNRKRVGPVLACGPYSPRSEYAIAVHLDKGINDILIKLAHPDAAFNVSCRIADINGKPIDDIAVRLPPSLVAVRTGSITTKVGLSFSEPMDKATLDDAANYAIEPEITVTAAKAAADLMSVTLTTSEMTPGTTYTVSLVNLKSRDTGNVVKSNAHKAFAFEPKAEVNGLTGEYFNSADFKEPALVRLDPLIDFAWGGNAPDPAVKQAPFSVRWSGTVTPKFSETYTLTTTCDDGQRLWIDGKQLVDDWVPHGPTDKSGTIALEAGRAYALTMEMYNAGGGANARLMWSSPSQPAEVVPEDRLSTPNPFDRPDLGSPEAAAPKKPPAPAAPKKDQVKVPPPIKEPKKPPAKGGKK